jgi:hypothetical protein
MMDGGMKRFFALLPMVCLGIVLAACAGLLAPSPSPMPTATVALTPTGIATFTLTPSPTSTPTATLTPTKTRIPRTATPDLSYLFNFSGKPLPYWNGLPVMAQAIAGDDKQDMYRYYLKASLEVVRQYYLQEMPRWGWQLFTSSGGKSGDVLIFIKGHTTVTVGIVVRGELVSVMLINS